MIGRRFFYGLCLVVGLGWAGGWESAASQVENAGATTWSDEKLAEFLTSGRRAEALYIQELQVIQHGAPLPLYNRVGYEERHRNLGRRPILRSSQVTGPFIRSTQFVARVNREWPIRILLRCALVRPNPDATHGIQTVPVETLIAYWTPGRDDEHVQTAPQGTFQIDLDAQPHYQRVELQVRSGRDERHTIDIRFINHKQAVTLEF